MQHQIKGRKSAASFKQYRNPEMLMRQDLKGIAEILLAILWIADHTAVLS